MQLLVSSLIRFLIIHLSGGKISVEMQRLAPKIQPVNRRNEKLKIVYAGHGIFKDKHFGIVRCGGRLALSIEVHLCQSKLTKDKYEVFVWTDIQCSGGY
jgi:hypothetical protein